MAGQNFVKNTLIALLLCLLIASSQVLVLSSSVVTLRANIICNNIQGLVEKQIAICNSRPDAIVVIGDGAKMAAKECQWQFKNHRWNCSLVGSMTSLQLGEDLHIGSREAGFASSIKAAGIAYYLTQGCSTGVMKACGCDQSKPEGKWSKDNAWKWGGCSADIGYGVEFSRIFVDASETSRQARSLMNLHNNRAGRKLMRNLVELECKCHGPSGSCTLKTCWTSLPSFRKVGTELMNRYHKAKHVEPVQLRKKQEKQVSLKLLRSKRSDIASKRPRKADLVFLDNSPNYCDANEALGLLGTEGRLCNKTSTGSDSCHRMCCGRGYNTHEYQLAWQCDCKFHWCCHVTCKECREDTEIYSCK